MSMSLSVGQELQDSMMHRKSEYTMRKELNENPSIWADLSRNCEDIRDRYAEKNRGVPNKRLSMYLEYISYKLTEYIEEISYTK